MKSFYKLNNSIRKYDWGHTVYIPEMLGIYNDKKEPFAELWMGGHPSAPSVLAGSGNPELTLADCPSEYPTECLGEKIYQRFGRLPYLFKLLAAGKALSIQAHPDKKKAEEGFERENMQGIPLDSPERNYKDNNHKPEIIMALTPFTAMIGFLTPGKILENFRPLLNSSTEIYSAQNFIDKFENLSSSEKEEEALKLFFDFLFSLNKEETLKLTVRAAEMADERKEWNTLIRKWLKKLSEQFPGDTGVLAPLFLNLLEIQPYQALYQPAGMLHAYLEGFGLELMANSDNVLRGGLTSKHVDVKELRNILYFRSSRPEIISADSSGNGFKEFVVPAGEFRLKTADITENKSVIINKNSGPSIIIVLENSITVSDSKTEMIFKRGESFFIPYSAPQLTIEGNGVIASAEAGK